VITRRIVVTQLWRRFVLSTTDTFGIADLELAPGQRLATDSFAVVETVTTRRTPVEIIFFSDFATHS
jgi:hypothetical protein